MLIAAAQTRPEDATSNLAAWYEIVAGILGQVTAPDWLANPSADVWGFWTGVFGLLIGIAVIGYSLRTRSSARGYDVQLLFENTDYYERVKGDIRRFRVGFVNNTERRLEKVFVRLDDCKDETGRRPDLDMPLGLQRDEGLGPAPLSPNSPKHATVVLLDEGSPGAPIVIPRISSLRDTPGGYEVHEEHLDRRKCYLLTVGAHPTTSQPHQMTFRVWVDSEGRLRMARHVARSWRLFPS